MRAAHGWDDRAKVWLTMTREIAISIIVTSLLRL